MKGKIKCSLAAVAIARSYRPLPNDEKGRKDGGNKREVSRFLQQQNDSEPINTALADALAKLKK